MATNLPTSNSTQYVITTNSATNSQLFDQLYSFFLNKTASSSAATQITQTLITLTNDNKLDPLSIIQEFDKAANNSELKLLLIALCNSLRPSSSKIGYQYDVAYNKWVQRNIFS